MRSRRPTHVVHGTPSAAFVLATLSLAIGCFRAQTPTTSLRAARGLANAAVGASARQGPADSVVDGDSVNALRAAIDPPDAFVVVDRGPAAMKYTPCATHLRDERDSTLLTLMASFVGASSTIVGDTARTVYGGYETTPSGRYGLQQGELLRVACRLTGP